VVVFDERNPDKPLRLLTSLLDVPAHVIAALYRWRWQIELFFRWLKVHAHFAHLISRSRNGMTMGFHVAVIAVLLIYLHTGRPMSKYAYNLLSLVAMGCGTIEDVLPILARRERECHRERERQAAKRAAKKNP
jgi:Transposase DDE domain